jgi:hypothetical protein
MKKPRMVADLLAVTDICIEALKAQAQLFESRGKGSSKKKRDNREVNMTDRGDHKDCGDHGYRGYHQQQSSDQKEKMHVRRPDDVEKWCEIHRTSGYNLKECKTFLDRKKMSPPAAPVAQEPHWGGHCRVNPPDDDEQMGEINMIFGGSISIASKTQGKKLEREINLA